MNRFLKALFSHYRFLYLIVAFICILGLKAFFKMPSSIYPPLSFPRVVIVAEVGNMSPKQIDPLVTRPIEQAVSIVPYVKRVRAKTIRGSVEISVDFVEGIDMDKALARVQGRIASIQSELPPNTNLTIERLTPGAFPVMVFNVSSKTLPLVDLQDIVKYQIQPTLLRISGVARVLPSGGDTRELDVDVDPFRLAQALVTPQQIANALQKTNHLAAVGRIQQYHQQSLVIGDTELQSPGTFNNIAIPEVSGTPVKLGELADVHQGILERTSLVSGPKGLCVSMSILKQPDANMLTVSHEVRAALQELKKHLPADITISSVYDQADLVRASVNNVKEAILFGVLLIVGVLFIFLKDWRTTLLATLTIPLTVLCTFWIMQVTGQDLNLMSLGGIAVAIGLVIDDAIVVIENVHRHRLHLAQDKTLMDVVHHAVGELVGPIISSTITTVVVFLPLGLLSGVAGQFFQALSFTLTVAVLISLIIALTVLPILAQQFLITKDAESSTEKPSARYTLEGIYLPYLRKILIHPKPQILGLVFLLICGGFIAGHIATGFFPRMDEGGYVVDYIAPPGSSLQSTNKIAHIIEGVLRKTPEVLSWSRRTGAELGFFATEQNKGDFLVLLKPKEKRSRSVYQIIDAQRQQLQTVLPGIDIGFSQVLQDQLNDLAGAPSPLEVKVFGQDATVLEHLAKEIKAGLSHIPGIADLKLGTQLSSPETHLIPNTLAMAQMGLTPEDVNNQVQTALFGTVVSQYHLGDRYINVRLRYPFSYREHLGHLPLFTANGSIVPLSAVASLVSESGDGQIQRENQQRYISIEGAPENRDLGSIQKDVQKFITHFSIPAGYRLEIGGLFASQQKSFQQLTWVLLLSGRLVYLVMVFQFRSFLKPLLILSVIPLGLSGVMVTLWVTRTALNVASFMGMILLTGLVVKNGIILMTYADEQVDAGVPLLEAVQAAGRIRLKPILMTTLATMLGLFPLALGWGSGAELQQPLAIAVIGGLFFSTYMSLTLLPWLYLKLVSALQK